MLSAVGLVASGVDWHRYREAVRWGGGDDQAVLASGSAKNPALNAALHHYLLLTKHGKTIQVAFPYVNRLWGTAFWFRQLWAESLGKRKDRAGNVVNVGQTPVAALGTTDQHSQVQLYMEGPERQALQLLDRQRASAPRARFRQKQPATRVWIIWQGSRWRS